MKRSSTLAIAFLVALSAGAYSAAGMADNYVVQVKAPGSPAPAACATGGGFAFSKAAPAAVTVTITLAPGCLGNLTEGNYSGSLSVAVENVTLNDQDQGQNVVGLSGTLTGPNGDQLGFLYTPNSASTGVPDRDLNLLQSNQIVSTGSYYLFNTAQAPEPSVTGLLLGGLGALLVVGRLRRRR